MPSYEYCTNNGTAALQAAAQAAATTKQLFSAHLISYITDVGHSSEDVAPLGGDVALKACQVRGW
jgi:hypothetical protein